MSLPTRERGEAAPTNAEPKGLAADGWFAGWSYAQAVWAFIGASILVRLIVAANVPLAFDEALYWRYSKHLAAGFLDHPFMNPLMIRLGTTIFGDTPLGARFFAVILAIPASWAVWRAGAALFRDERLGATAALFFNVTVVMTIGSLLATSDQVVVTTSAFLLFALAKVNETQKGIWWLAVGAAFGLGMCSKYTTAFFAISMFAWLVIVPENRRWFLNPWPYAGGLLAAAVFAPVILWNADHNWASFAYQSNRMTVHSYTLRYLGEVIASQFGLATPSVFILICIGLFSVLPKQGEHRSARVLILASILPIVFYFVWHSLHERVQGNWPEAMYPAVAVGAAYVASYLAGRTNYLGLTAKWSSRLAVPVGVVLAVIGYSLAAFASPFGIKNPTSRILGFGWTELAAAIDAERQRQGAPVIIGTEYQVVSWLTLYLPSHAPVEQITQRMRWANEPTPDPSLFTGPMVYICRVPCMRLPTLEAHFGVVRPLSVLPRKRGDKVVEQYALYLLSGPTRPVLEPADDLTADLTQ